MIYIASTPDAIWKALLDGEFTRQYWGQENVSDWQPGSAWLHRDPGTGGQIRILGEVLEARPPHRLVITWAEPKERGTRDRHSRVAFDIEAVGEMVRLTMTHDELETGSEMDRSIRQAGRACSRASSRCSKPVALFKHGRNRRGPCQTSCIESALRSRRIASSAPCRQSTDCGRGGRRSDVRESRALALR